MSEKTKVLYYRRAVWFRDFASASLCYIPAGVYEPGVAAEPTIAIPDDALRSLVEALDELGLIKPRLDERLRAEDLKITHRLLDIIERAVEDEGLALVQALEPLPDIIEEVDDAGA